VLDWPTRPRAERLRQWPLIVHAAETAAKLPELDGLMLLGSFAAGRADEVSDVDLMAVVGDGCFEDAWARRRELETAGTLFRWDVHVASDRDTASHKWITRDIVKVECCVVDAARSTMQLAEPYAVIVGDATAPHRFPPLETIAADVLEACAKELRDQGLLPEVETLRRAMSGET
jgi:predicted nucleotidyltransferase